ncbi:hypothetical protein CDIK_1352 [Cucumispora dikerogammari]|nr:hypothetical protein CDIK_1352 [Cucumispora dikerogammari]
MSNIVFLNVLKTSANIHGCNTHSSILSFPSTEFYDTPERSQINEVYLRLENCMVYDKNMLIDEFKKAYLDTGIENDKSFLPISDHPIYLEPKNFNTAIPLEYISLSVSYITQLKAPDTYKYKNCYISVNKCWGVTKIGIIGALYMKQYLLTTINEKEKLKFQIKLKVNKTSKEITIMNIFLMKEHIRVSTISILDHFLSENLFSYSETFDDKLQKYQFLHYLYALAQIKKHGYLRETLQQKPSLTISTFALNCQTPVFLLKQTTIETRLLEKRAEAILKKLPKPMFIYYTSEHDTSYSEIQPRTIIKLCYNPEYLCSDYKLLFSESIDTHEIISHTVLFNIKDNKVEYTKLVEREQFRIVKNPTSWIYYHII